MKFYSLKINKNIQFLIKNNILYIKFKNNITYIPILKDILLFQNTKKNTLFFTFSLNKKNKYFEINLKIFKLYYQLILNKINGLINGFFSQLECKGLGYKAKLKNSFLILKLGFSHKLSIKIPTNIHVFCSKSNNIIFFSNDKQKLYLFMYKVKAFRKPDNYKGKGLKLKKEVLKLKEGKKSQ